MAGRRQWDDGLVLDDLRERHAFVSVRASAVASAFALVLGTLMVGCDAADPRQSGGGAVRGVETRDSAGVEIVDNHSPEWPPSRAWAIDPDPDIVVGGTAARGTESVAAGQVVWQVRGVARLADGRVAVLTSEDARLAVYEPTGELSGTIGGKGRGPGEFGRPQHLQYLPPDTLVVWDYMMGPVSYFHSDGTLLRSRRLDLGRITAEEPGISAESRVIPLADGSFVAVATRSDPDFVRSPGSTARYPAVEYLRVDVDHRVQAIASGMGEEIWVPEPGTGVPLPDLPTFVLDSHVAVGGSPPRIYTSDGNRNEIRQYSPAGDLVRIIRRTTDPVPVTDAAHRAWQQSIADFFASLGAPAADEIFREVPRRETWPPVAGLVVDTEGHLWVREWSSGETGVPDQWSVFSAEGRWLGTLRSFPDLLACHWYVSPCWIGKDHLLAVRRDEFGDERVEGYRIRRENPASALIRHEAGDVFQDCEACPKMMVVPAGTFTMGAPDWEELGEEYKPRPVSIPEPFAVGVHEVTFFEWEACVQAGGCGGHVPDDRGWGRGLRPVINVSWYHAQAYVRWLSEFTGREYRLLSEAEWEYVARAGTETTRYWGDDPSEQCRYANGYDEVAHTAKPHPIAKGPGCADGYAFTSPVGVFLPNGFGLYDVLGNVQEWTEDCLMDEYLDASGACEIPVKRGGFWGGDVFLIRSDRRGGWVADSHDSGTGFRVARELE